MARQSPDGSVPAWRPEAVVFDVDGLLVDTEPCWTVAETELFRRRGRSFGDEEKALLIGRSLSAAAVTLAEEFDEPGNEEGLIDELLVLVREAVQRGARVMPGAPQLVALARAALPVAVASNSPRHLMDVALDRAGLAGSFAVSVAADEVTDPKPAPDMYVEACRRLGIDPSRALAFEDSGTGLRSAMSAGLRTVTIPTLASQELTADWVWTSLDDPTLLAWAKTW